MSAAALSQIEETLKTLRQVASCEGRMTKNRSGQSDTMSECNDQCTMEA